MILKTRVCAFPYALKRTHVCVTCGGVVWRGGEDKVCILTAALNFTTGCRYFKQKDEKTDRKGQKT